MQLDLYLKNNNLYSSMQSDYRRFHSTETALIKVFTDICCALDCGKNAVLILLDLSCAFVTLDHEILISRLRTRFGFTGNVLKWLQSYLSDRRQFVIIDCTHSSQNRVRWGVPQGSVLGPLLFNLYISPVEDIILAHGLYTMLYANDTQLYISLEPNNDQKLKVLWNLAYLTCTTGFLQICLYAIVINPISSILHQNFTTILVRSLSRLGHQFCILLILLGIWGSIGINIYS